MGGATPHQIAFLSGHWLTWTDGPLVAQRPFMAEEPTGRDFEPTGQDN